VPWDGVAFVLYLLVVLAIGVATSRRIGDAEDFHLCGRKLGPVTVSLSLAATVFSGSGLIGGAGLAYSIGVSGSYWNLTAVPAWILIGMTLVMTMRRLRLRTVPGYLGERYGLRTRRLIASLQIVEAVTFVAVQITVSRLALETLFHMNGLAAALIVTAVFVAYTAMGGLWAVVWTDIVQYVVLMSAVVLGLTFALAHVGGLSGLHASLPADRFSMGALGVQTPLAWFALCVYSWGTDQAYMQRAFAARDASTARTAYLFTGFTYLIFGVCVAGIGMAASVLVPGLHDPDQAFPQLIARVIPNGLRGFFLTGILATTMSTASAYLAASSSVLVQDVYEPLAGPGLHTRKLLRVSRYVTVLLAAAALAIALNFPNVVDAVIFSTLVAPAAMFFPLVFALYRKHADPLAGFCAILAGALAGVIDQVAVAGRPGLLGAINPLFAGPAIGLAVLLLVTALRGAQKSRPVQAPVLDNNDLGYG
jgi:SSS family solute:Na+ symporter